MFFHIGMLFKMQAQNSNKAISQKLSSLRKKYDSPHKKYIRDDIYLQQIILKSFIE